MSKKTSTAGTADWKVKTLPDFKGKKAFVLPGAFYSACVGLMAEAGFTRATSVADSDVVVFIGGEDINPALYGQKNVKSYFTQERDDLEVEIYKRAQELGKVCFGICRGAQFLHAMNGGTLWQDVNNHAGRSHYIVDLDEDCRVLATSMHHQMLQDNDTLEVVAVAEEQVATSFIDEDLHIDLNGKGVNASHEVEVEAGTYPKTKCFFVQGHPEVGNPEYRSWTMQRLYDYFLDWTADDSGSQLAEILNKQEVK